MLQNKDIGCGLAEKGKKAMKISTEGGKQQLIMNMEKCEKCFWNYNCPYYDGMEEDEWTEKALEDFEKCERWKEQKKILYLNHGNEFKVYGN